MIRRYEVGLRLVNQIPDALLTTGFKDYIHSLSIFLPDKTLIGGSNLFLYTAEDICIRFTSSDFGFWYHKPIDGLEAVKSALAMAKRLEIAQPPFNPSLKFNPNYIKILVDRDAQGDVHPIEDFLPHAIGLQKRLYHGGDITHFEEPIVFLGTENLIKNPRVLIAHVEGTAQPASSLDELLARLEQK